jgi:hypothetical protein
MGWGRGQQHRLWRAEFKDVSTPELRSKVASRIYDPDKQRVIERLLRRREHYMVMTIITTIGGVIGIIVGAIGIIVGAIAIFKAFW